MRKKPWVIGVFGVVIGVSVAIGAQWAINNLPSGNSTPSLNDYEYQGFEDDYALDNISWDDFYANQYPEENSTPINDEIYDLNWYEFDQLEDNTYFLVHGKVETILGIEVRYTTFAHLTQDLNVIWEYEFIPSESYIEKFAINSLNDLTFNVYDIEIFGNTAILGLFFENHDFYFDEVTQIETAEFIGDNFLPIGADENADNMFYSVALSINLNTYAFEVLVIESASPAFDIEWESFIVIGDDLLVHAKVRSSDPSAGVSIFGAILDGQFQYFNFFFRYSLNEDEEVEIENLGYILTNLALEFNWYDIHDFNGYFYEVLDNKIHLAFVFEYNESLAEYASGERVLVDFSNTFDLITADGRSDIETFIQNFELLDTTEEIILIYHAFIDIRTLDVFHDEIVDWSVEVTQNDVWIDLRMIYTSEDDFAILTNEETYNNDGGGDFPYQLINASTTLKQYTDGTLEFEMTFSDDQVVLFTHLIRTENHYLFAGRTNQRSVEGEPGSYSPSVIILLTDLDFAPMDTLIIDTEAPTYIEGILLEETTLTVVFWSVTDKEEFTAVLGEEDNYKAEITLILA